MGMLSVGVPLSDEGIAESEGVDCKGANRMGKVLSASV